MRARHQLKFDGSAPSGISSLKPETIVAFVRKFSRQAPRCRLVVIWNCLLSETRKLNSAKMFRSAQLASLLTKFSTVIQSQFKLTSVIINNEGYSNKLITAKENLSDSINQALTEGFVSGGPHYSSPDCSHDAPTFVVSSGSIFLCCSV